MSDLTKIIVDGEDIEVPNHYTLLQAAEAAGAEVPRFCFHDRLSVAGNCRMCLVEVKGGPPKPAASCAMGVRDLRPGPDGEPPEIFTKTPMVKKAREGVMEFLLINHPLDCPICDQGGECDLQDQAMAYGMDGSRFDENKRAVEDKYIGPLVRTKMTRCIHCTRCVRFTTEIAGVSDLGLIGRGEDAEITTYLESAMTSELQGNVIDLCPVGALTSRPYQDKARPWELNKSESIDVMDAVGSAIRVDTRGREVMRIMPRLNEEINEEWISDKSRFIWDGLKSQRLDKPYIKVDGRLQPASWQVAFEAISQKIKATTGEKIGAIAGDLSGAEEMFATKLLLNALGSNILDCRQKNTALHPENGRASYIFNTTIEGIENADAILLIGTNPRIEASLLNARIRKAWRGHEGRLPIGLIGEPADLTYEYKHLGTGPDALSSLISGKDDFAKILQKAERPLILIGEGALCREDGADILASAAHLAELTGALNESWNGFSVMASSASLVGGLDIGFVPAQDTSKAVDLKSIDVLFLLGADEIDLVGDAFKIYIGSHGDKGAHQADIVLPAAAYTEKSALYVNLEGRVQMTNRAAFPPGQAREDWTIIRALSDALGQTLPFNTLNELRSMLYEAHPHFAKVGEIASGDRADIQALAKEAKDLSGDSFKPFIVDFYLTNPIARASKVMANCSALANRQFKQVAE